MILEPDVILHSIGIIGIVIFYIVLARLSALMGKGLRLSHFYLWYYVASLLSLLTIPIHLYLHTKYENPHLSGSALDIQSLYFFLFLLSNIIVIIVSFRYWWWLKDELLRNRNRERISPMSRKLL